MSRPVYKPHPSYTTPRFSSTPVYTAALTIMNTKKPAASYYPCPVKASSIFTPQPPPVPMYYARNPVRLTFEDADWGTLTDNEDSGSEQELSSCSLVPTEPLIRPKLAEVSIRDLRSFGKPLASALSASGTAEEVKHNEELSADQRKHSTPGELTWTGSLRTRLTRPLL